MDFRIAWRHPGENEEGHPLSTGFLRMQKTSLIVGPGLCPVNRSHWHFGVLPNELAGSFIEVRKRPVLEPCRR